jgi:hypothetical protein
MSDRRELRANAFTRPAMCEGKVAFESLKLARHVAKRRAHRERPGDRYLCAHCGCWHIGASGR